MRHLQKMVGPSGPWVMICCRDEAEIRELAMDILSGLDAPPGPEVTLAVAALTCSLFCGTVHLVALEDVLDELCRWTAAEMRSRLGSAYRAGAVSRRLFNDFLSIMAKDEDFVEIRDAVMLKIRVHIRAAMDARSPVRLAGPEPGRAEALAANFEAIDAALDRGDHTAFEQLVRERKWIEQEF